jgi:hypothetical protein
MQSSKWLTTAAGIALCGALACTDGVGSVKLSLSARTPAGPAPFAALSAGSPASVVAAGDSTMIVLGSDTVILRSAALVIRQIELKKLETAKCDGQPETSDCEEFETGPFLATLPLGATMTAAVIAVNAPAGQYDELDFEVHKAEAPDDAAFISANPTFDRISIRVTGTYSQAGTRSDFVYTSDLNESQNVNLPTPLTVSNGTPANVTLRLDVSAWFLNAGRTALVNPASGNKGQPNERVVADNIKKSIDAFRDENQDGRDDDHEGT